MGYYPNYNSQPPPGYQPDYNYRPPQGQWPGHPPHHRPPPKVPLGEQFVHAFRVIAVSLAIFMAVTFIALVLGSFIGSFITEDQFKTVELLTFGIAWIVGIGASYFLIMPYLKLKLNLVSPLKGQDWAYISITYVAISIVAVIVTTIIAILIDFDEDFDQFPAEDFDLGIDKMMILLLAEFLIVAVLVPIVEEILFRGILYKGLRQKLGFISAAILSSIIFAVLHIQSHLVWQANLILITVILCLSLGITYAYEKTGNLWVCIIIHMINNAIATLVAFQYFS